MEQATPQNQAQLWQLYVKGLQKLSHLWAELLRQSLESTSRGIVGNAATSGMSAGHRSPLSELTDLYWNIYEKTFGSILLSPNLGYTREFNHKLLQGFDSWINFSKASFDYQIVLVNVWVRTFEELIRELASSQEKSEKIQDWRQLLQIWSSVFDRVFAQTFDSEDALAIQGNFLNAAMTYRLQQQKILEVFLKMNDLPVRSEVDEIHHSIYELRKELKSLKKALTEFPNNA
jgi:class III poly(R)-hydroxyalkanoic acid synthase PhaE subunit